MYGECRKWVFILSKDKVPYDRYYLPIIKKIYFRKDLDSDKIEAIQEIAKCLEVETEEI